MRTGISGSENHPFVTGTAAHGLTLFICEVYYSRKKTESERIDHKKLKLYNFDLS